MDTQDVLNDPTVSVLASVQDTTKPPTISAVEFNDLVDRFKKTLLKLCEYLYTNCELCIDIARQLSESDVKPPPKTLSETQPALPTEPAPSLECNENCIREIRAMTFDVLTMRDRIQSEIEKGVEITGDTFNTLFLADDCLYQCLVELYQSSFRLQLRFEQWRYVKRDTNALHWWWFHPSKIRRVDDQFAHYYHSYTRQLAVTIIVISMIYLGFNTFRLIRDEQIIAAIVNVGVQLLLGGVLISPFTYTILQGFGQGFLRLFGFIPSTVVALFRMESGARRSLHDRPAVLPEDSRLLGLALFLAVIVFVLPMLITTGADQLFERAVWAVDGGVNLNAGEFYLDLVNRLDPSNPEAAAKWAQLGVLYQESGRADKAAEMYQRALEYDGRIILAIDQLAEYYIDIGEYNRAVLLQNRGIRLLSIHLFQPDVDEDNRIPMNDDEAAQWYFRTLVTRGRAYLNLGLPQNALQDFEAALEFAMNPEYDQLFEDPNNAPQEPLSPAALSTMEAYFRRGFAFVLLALQDTCTERYIAAGVSDFSILSRFPETPLEKSAERVWRNIAGRARTSLSSITCDELKMRDLSWLQQHAY